MGFLTGDEDFRLNTTRNTSMLRKCLNLLSLQFKTNHLIASFKDKTDFLHADEDTEQYMD